MAGIFISYRREDSRHAAGRLVDRLAQVFPREQLFLDIDAVEPGLDFLKVINAKLAECEVLLAVIGPGWADARNEDGIRRLDDPDDFVRLELEAALTRDIRVVPVLVDGAQPPRADKLPDGLKPLVRRNAVRLAHERFGAEADSLARSLMTFVQRPGSAGGAAGSQTAAERGKTPAHGLRGERQRLIGRLKFAGASFVAAGAVYVLLVVTYSGPVPAWVPIVGIPSFFVSAASLIAVAYFAVKLKRLQH